MTEQKSIVRTTRISLLLVAIAFVLSLATVFVLGRRTEDERAAALRHDRAIRDLDQLVSKVTEAESGQRGYLLVGNRQYLQPYSDATDSINGLMHRLQDESAEVGFTANELDSVDGLVASKLGELKATVDFYNAHGETDAVAIVKTGRGKQLMTDLRAQVDAMTERQRGLLARELEQANQFGTTGAEVSGAMVLLSLCVLFLAHHRILDQSSKRMAALAAVGRQRELYEVTLRSIGDGVIVTDAAGEVTFMNEVAGNLTGWTAEEAVGRPCSEVFKIVNEESGATVESPVEKVVRLGTIVGLANHTVLLRRDGSELPIDDSGAPIRDESGALVGVVLVFRDFSEYKVHEQTLRSAKVAAEEASVAKDTFLATLSHELRTPLTPVVGLLAAWSESPDFPEKYRADAQMMRRSVDLEARLIDDILDVARLSRGKLTLNPEQTDLHRLITETVEICSNQFKVKNIQVRFELEAVRHHVFGDASRLQQVLWNVLTNAGKFTPAGGMVTIRTFDRGPELIEVAIEDTGVGMSEEVLDRAFQPFEQGPVPVTGIQEGLGLGLALTRSLVSAHDGEITAESPGPGKGSTFTIRLPSVSVPVDPPDDPPRAAAPTTDPPLRILLVEDHADSAVVLSRLLERHGHHVTTAGSVEEAWAFFQSTPPDVVLSDLGLPDGSGIDLIRRIRTSGRGSTPAIVVTGFGMERDVALCMEAGFDRHVTKPINAQRLNTILSDLVNGRRTSAPRP